MRKTILMLFSILTYGRATSRSEKPMRARFYTCLIGALVLSSSLTAQEDMSRKLKRVTYEQMTEQMVKELQLNEKQQKKVAKLNKKYKTLIEGEQMERPQGQRPPMGERPSGSPSGSIGGPGGEKSYDYDKQQQKYDKAIGKILSEQQYESYLDLFSSVVFLYFTNPFNICCKACLVVLNSLDFCSRCSS